MLWKLRTGVANDRSWIVSISQKASYDNVFETLQRYNDKATGATCRQTMINSGLNQRQLGSIWNLSDLDKDGSLDRDEFALCMYLMEEVAFGAELRTILPKNYIPPSKRATSSAVSTDLQRRTYPKTPVLYTTTSDPAKDNFSGKNLVQMLDKQDVARINSCPEGTSFAATNVTSAKVGLTLSVHSWPCSVSHSSYSS